MGVAPFITLEGVEASGKTTLLHGLCERLRTRGREALITREPGGTPTGDRLRALLLQASDHMEPLAELFIVCAARAQHVAAVIAPALHAGRTVLCDRFTDATRAYQGGGRGIDDALIRTCCDYAARGIVPLLTLLVDVPPEISAQRVALRTQASGIARDRLEQEDDAFHVRVRRRYLEIARAEPERVKVLDGTLAAEALLEEAWSHVAPVLALS